MPAPLRLAALLALPLAFAACATSADQTLTTTATQPDIVATAAPAPAVLPLAEPTPVLQPTPTPQPERDVRPAFPTPEPWQPASPAPIEGAAADESVGEAPGAPSATTTDSSASSEAAGTSAETAVTPTRSGATYELGSCLADLSGAGASMVVACNQPHRVEVYHVAEFPDDQASPHPGDAMLAQAMEQCAPSFEALPGVAQSGESFEVQVHGPSQSQWENGDRFLACLLVFPEQVDQPLIEIDRTVPPAQLGDCFTGSDTSSLVSADCQEPHTFQVYATTGALELEEAEDFCRRALGDESLFIDFNKRWQADVIVGDEQVNCYLASAEPTTGSVLDKPSEG